VRGCRCAAALHAECWPLLLTIHRVRGPTSWCKYPCAQLRAGRLPILMSMFVLQLQELLVVVFTSLDA